MSESDVRKRSNKRWLWVALYRLWVALYRLWVALCRRTRQVVAFVIGDRSAKTCARLWSRIPEGYRQGRSFSDFWKSYRPVFEQNPQSDSLDHQQLGPPTGWTTNRSESPAVSWLTSNDSSGGFGRSWPGMSDGREQPPSQNECFI